MTLTRTLAFAGLVALTVGVGARDAAAQGAIRGVAYDSLAGAPLAGAAVWLQGTTRQAATDARGRFHFDSVPAGRHVLVLAHPHLDSLGLFNVAAAAVVARDTPAVTLAVPSLAGFWRRRCGQAYTPGGGVDSGLVYGTVRQAESGSRLAGAAVLATWVRLVISGPQGVHLVDHDARTATDSVGAFSLCGVPADVTVHVRAYARADSSGELDVLPGGPGVAVRDVAIALPAPGQDRRAALRGRVTDETGAPVSRARVTVREWETVLTGPDGTFFVGRLPGGTQWVTVQAIGRGPVEQAVDLRGGDTATIAAALAPLPVTLDTVRVTARESRVRTEIDDRRRSGMGFILTEAQIHGRSTMNGVFVGIPSVVVTARNIRSFEIALLRGTRTCVPPLYIDRRRADHTELINYRPEDLIAVEVYNRTTTAPIEYQRVAEGCGVILVWTKYVG